MTAPIVLDRTVPPVESARPIPFGRLVAVELRKSVDTRAAKAVLATFLGIGLAVLAFTAVGDPQASLGAALLPGITLMPALPVVAVLVMTSEWAQRTASTTFRLEPRRLRVLTAKLVASLTLTITLVTAVVVASGIFLAAVLPARGLPLALEDVVGLDVRLVFVGTLLATLFGVAWGSLLMSTPVALVFTLLASLLIDAILMFTVGDLAPWISSGTLTGVLVGDPEGSSGSTAVGAIITSTVLWYLGPLVAGFWVQNRREAR